MLMKVLQRVRVSQKDVHYGGDLVPGSYVIGLFGDVATEAAILVHGDEGLWVNIENCNFLHPVYPGDIIEVSCEVLKKGNTSLKLKFEARKVITAKNVGPYESSGELIEKPLLICEAIGTTVVPKSKQWKVD